MARKQKKTGKRKGKQTSARRADKHDLYQRAVQEVEADVPFIERIFRRHRGRPARSLREDFCGTALMACNWVTRHEENTSVGIDLDANPLEWGRQHNVAQLTPEQASRIKLIQGDVLDVPTVAVDITCAFNFSYFVFHKRAELLRYFRRSLAALAPDGILFLDLYGGADAQKTLSEGRDIAKKAGREKFEYVWDQHKFDPIHHHAINYIHFEFQDGSRLRRAFKYDWRLWTIPELRDLLEEAGFAKNEVFWEATDGETGEGTGVFVRRESAEDDPAWIAYIAALR